MTFENRLEEVEIADKHHGPERGHDEARRRGISERPRVVSTVCTVPTASTALITVNPIHQVGGRSTPSAPPRASDGDAPVSTGEHDPPLPL